MEQSICKNDNKACAEAAKSLLEASYLDIDYTTSLTLTAFWASPPGGWTERIAAPPAGQTKEIGVLTHEPNPDPEDIGFGGFLTVLGRDSAPKPTRFQTPTLHYPLSRKDAAFTTSFDRPTGLHPTLRLAFSATKDLDPPDESCKLHAHLTLPSYLFIDRYQFSDPLFLASHNLAALVNVSGATDLEAPDWVVPQWGSAALFELASPEEDDERNAQSWEVSIPMHLRYLPAAAASHARVPVPWPVVFWACDAQQDASGNPFHREHLGYDQAFGEGVRFMHVPPGQKTGELVEWIEVPVLDTRVAGWVETGTIGVVVVAFLGLCWVLLGGGKTGKEVPVGKKKQ